jgi:DNA-binding transcriptional MerR regulator
MSVPDLAIPGPRTKAALALAERRRRAQTTIRKGVPMQAVHVAATVPAPRFSLRSSELPIGVVAEQLGLTLRAIRHYEEMGLIACGRGPKNVRTLGQTARARLAAIADLKALGLPISEIADLLGEDGACPDRLKARLRAQLEALDARRTAIAGYLSGL